MLIKFHLKSDFPYEEFQRAIADIRESASNFQRHFDSINRLFMLENPDKLQLEMAINMLPRYYEEFCKCLSKLRERLAPYEVLGGGQDFQFELQMAGYRY